MRHLMLLICGICAGVGCGTNSASRRNDLALLQLKSKCREDGEKTRATWKTRYYQDTFSDEPQYAYSESLQTCLWLDEYRGPSFDRNASGKIIPVQTRVRFILDIYSNKPLIEYTEHGGEQIGDVSLAAFNQKRAEFFNSVR